jgi:hypothetical protein
MVKQVTYRKENKEFSSEIGFPRSTTMTARLEKSADCAPTTANQMQLAFLFKVELNVVKYRTNYRNMPYFFCHHRFIFFIAASSNAVGQKQGKETYIYH